MSYEHQLPDVEFSSAVERIMGLLVDAGFQNVSTSCSMLDHYGELSFYDDEASRLLRIIRLGLNRNRVATAVSRRRVSDDRLVAVLDAYNEAGIDAVKKLDNVGARQAYRLVARAQGQASRGV